MKRVIAFVYGMVSYLVSLATFLYAAGFIGNFGVSKSMDSPASGPWQTAFLIDLGLIVLFSIQHSVMARPAFKKLLVRFLPASVERSTYVLASSVALLLVFWKWRPLGGTIWAVENTVGRGILYSGYAFGWLLLFATTFVINHFDLLGLRQVWLNLQGQPQDNLRFVTPWLYRIVRHPLYIGWFCIFWSTPDLTVTHLFFAVATTSYILVAIHFEERDLMRAHPEYAEYRRRVPMLVPKLTQEIKPVRIPSEMQG